MAPMLAANLPGTLLLKRALERPNALTGGAVALASTAAAVEVFAWTERHADSPVTRALKQPGYELQRRSARASPTSASSRSAVRRWRRSCGWRTRPAVGSRDPSMSPDAVAWRILSCRHEADGNGLHPRAWTSASLVGADHLHGADRLLPLADDEADAEHQAAGDQAGLQRPRSSGTTSPAPTRPRRSCRRSSTSCASPSASARSARRSPRASCCTARPAPARRCWPRRSPTSPARSSSPSRRPASSRCSPASAPRASGGCSARRASTRRRSSSSTRSTPSARARGSDNNSEREQTLNQLLVEMDGFARRGELVVIAASNLLEKLDPALLRPGRFDRQILVSPPDVDRPRGDPQGPHAQQAVADVDLATSRARPPGLTGADLANIANEAAISAARAHRAQRSSRRTSTARSSASWPACSRAARSTSTSAA